MVARHGGPASTKHWDATHLAEHRLVALAGPTEPQEGVDAPAGPVAGWASLSPVSARCIYAGVAEDSLYVDPAHRGRGVGRALLRALVESAGSAGIWTVQSGIFPENTASLALHAACGFRVVGRRERIARLHGRWRDVVLLERRSPTIV
jgi:L-amino acid N-acyltransferase YncA